MRRPLREAPAGPRYTTVVATPAHWHPRGEAVCVPLDRGGKPLDVWAGIPGEAEQIELLHTGQHRVIGRFYKAQGTPHPMRRDPPCDRFDACGGCPFMHLVPEGQAMARLSLLRDALDDVGLGVHAPSHLVPSPDGDVDYRHVVKVSLGRSDHGHIRVGAYARHTHRLVAIPDCLVATPTLRRAMATLAHHVIDLDVRPWEPETGRGLLRHAVMRQSRATGEVLVTLVAARRVRILTELAETLTHAMSELVGIHVHLNDDPGNAIFVRDEDGTVPTLNLRGQDLIEEHLGDLALALGPGDFYQANPGMAEVICEDLVTLLADVRERPVVDLYSGVGGFTLALGRAHGWALGVEAVGGAVLRARENARRNRITAEFQAGDVAQVLPDLERLVDRHPVVLVDPARRGLGDGVLPAILDLQPARLAYLSCNPRAMARDLAQFADKGWSVSALRAYDMFPQTTHVETLAILDPPQPPPEGLPAPRRRVVR